MSSPSSLERGQELSGEEGIAGRLVADEPRERRDALRLRVKGIGDQLRHVLLCEGRQRDLVHDRSGVANGVELPHQRMGGIDFVIAIRADDQQMPDVRPA